MAKQATASFLDFDFTKFMDPSAMDMSKFMDMGKFMDMDKLMGDMKLEPVMSAHQRNVDTFTQANRLAVEGMRAIMQRQVEIMRQGVEDASAVATQMGSVTTPSERLARQTELCKDLYERSVSNMKELSEMASKSNGEVMDLLNTRFSEALDEIKVLIETAPDLPAFPMPVATEKAAKPAAKANGTTTTKATSTTTKTTSAAKTASAPAN